MINYIHSVSSY